MLYHLDHPAGLDNVFLQFFSTIYYMALTFSVSGPYKGFDSACGMVLRFVRLLTDSRYKAHQNITNSAVFKEYVVFLPQSCVMFGY